MNVMHEIEKAHVSATIKAICRERHWSQADFARHANVGQDVVSAWVRQKVMPSIKLLHRVADSLGVDVDRFLLPEGATAAPVAQPKPVASPPCSGMKLEFPSNNNGLARIELSANIPPEAALKIAEIVNSVVSRPKDL